MQNEQPQAHFDNTLTAVEIERLTVRDKDVAREAQRWTAGGRGAAVDDPDALAAADLSQFVTEAVKIGAHALSATGQAQESRILEQMLREVGDKAADSTAKGGRHHRTSGEVGIRSRDEGCQRCQEGHHRGRRRQP